MVRARMFSDLARTAPGCGAAHRTGGPVFTQSDLCTTTHPAYDNAAHPPFHFLHYRTQPLTHYVRAKFQQSWAASTISFRAALHRRGTALSSASPPLIRRSGCPKKNSKGEPCQSRSGEECPYHGAEHSKLCGAITTSGKKCKVGAAPPDARARTWRRARHSSPAAAAAAAPAQVPADQKHHKGGHCRLHRDSA